MESKFAPKLWPCPSSRYAKRKDHGIGVEWICQQSDESNVMRAWPIRRHARCMNIFYREMWTHIPERFIPTKFLWIHTVFRESNGDFNERVSDFLEPDHGLLKISHYPRFSHFQELLFACAFPRFWASGDFWVTREATNDIQKSQFAPRIRAWSPTMQISGPFTFFALPVRYDSFSFSFGLFSRFLLVFHAHMAVILWFAF